MILAYKKEDNIMNLTYEKCGDYLIPNLIPDPEPEGELRKFGLMRKSYLENHRRGIYSGLLLSGELKKHLLMIQEQAEERFDLLVEQMAKREGVTEQLKAQNQMLWVQRMNSIRARAEEIVREEIIYCL
ncbi:hypothetical protein IMSAG025_00217 [Muribaculaceae bacterium]|jgi:hypothetical protein|nr:hypothetical protein IMSAG025_00217 [Muribaculaceae bacterium]